MIKCQAQPRKTYGGPIEALMMIVQDQENPMKTFNGIYNDISIFIRKPQETVQ